MEENMKIEIDSAAQYIGMTVEEAKNKFEEICSENKIETTNPIAKGLWRNFVANTRRTQESGKATEKTGDDSFYKSACGFFVSLEAPRDMMAWNRMQAKEEFMRDADKALENGIVAVATKNALGKWVVSRTHKDKYEEKVVTTLPSGAEETEDGRFFIPLDSTETYMNGGKNDNYGKPLAAETMRRSGIFFGSLGTGEMKPYYFSYKNQGGVDFAPNTFEWVHFLCVLGSNGTDIYGAKTLTLESLSLNSEMNPDNDLYRDVSGFDYEQCLRDNFNSHLVPLMDIDKAHITRQALPSKERFVITDGTVCNMNMTPTKNGNRIINITDLNAELDYENDSGMTTCWIPSHLVLDFGIGSTVIVSGRTSQRTTDEGVEPTTINVAGILCTTHVGAVVESSQPVEEDFDWF